MSAQIQPTHHCFDDALELMAERVKKNAALAHGATLLLVHGVALGTDGVVYAHAWIEEDDLCWDAGILDGQRIYYAVARDEYYAARRIQHATHYTVRQASQENVRSGHYGPWLARYRALCGTSTRIVGIIEARIRPTASTHHDRND